MLEKILPQAQGRIDVLSDLIPQAAYLLSGDVPVAPTLSVERVMTQMHAVAQMQFVLWRLGGAAGLAPRCLICCAQSIGRGHGHQAKSALFAPLLSLCRGESVAYSIPDSMAILGPDMTRARLATRHRGVRRCL